MKNVILSILSLLVINCTLHAQAKRDTLTNEKIIQLTKIGMASSIIVNKIKSSINMFDISTNGLINLTTNKVATDVINEMMSTSNVIIQNTELNSKDPLTMHKQGIYYYNPDDENNPLQKVDPGIVAGYHSSGGGYGGFGGSTEMADLSGSESMMKINQNSPVFYFYFDKSITNRGIDWFDVSSPKEFQLVKLIIKKGTRFFKVGGGSYTYGVDTRNSGIPQKDQVPFEYTLISEGIYKITIKNPLSRGEYCFVLASNTRKVFDFGIQ